MSFIEAVKHDGFYPEKGAKDRKIDEKNEFYQFYIDYESALLRANALDFGGLITAVLQLFEKYPQILERYQNRFQYILIDEYQDTNRAQFELMYLLAKERKNICVVGDEDQSIYSWRGADINNIFDFEEYFPQTEVVKLEQNYRSSKNIIESAAYVIANNKMRKGKNMWTENSRGEHIKIVECSDEKREARYVVSEIEKLSRELSDLCDIAIFYRANSQSRVLEDYLREIKIPYRVIGGIKFYERKEIKDVLGYLRMIVNPKDSLALARIINIPTRGIGATTLRKLENESIQNNCSLWEMIKKVGESPDSYSYLKLSTRIKSSLGEFVALVDEIRYLNSEGATPPHILYEKILHQSGYWQQLKVRKDYETIARMENLQELLGAIKQYGEDSETPTLSGFLEQIALDTPNEESTNDSMTKGEVSLMTVHGAKGLEFEYAFIVGVEEKVFPSYKSLEEGDGRLEEERRLFYVAMTRAMKRLYICFAQGRLLFGQVKFNGASRFIDEIPEQFYSWEKYGFDFDCDSEHLKSPHPFKRSIVYQEKKMGGSFKRGSRIRHALYGPGRVLSTEGFGKEEKVTILFNDGARKKFMVRFAGLESL